jgi:predicted Zn-dependent peptidase
MKEFKLKNGMSVAYDELSQMKSVCLGVGVGHVNEPKLGIANLFEKMILMQVKSVMPVFGGTMTAYTTGGSDTKSMIENLSSIFDAKLNEEYLEMAKQAIVQQTKDTAPLTMRRMKLLYKHTAFGADLVRTTEEYLAAINSYTIQDVWDFAATYYAASNLVLIVVGCGVSEDNITEWAEKAFKGIFEEGYKCESVANIYTGGFGRMDVDDNITRLMFGWDLKHLSISESPYINVMMSMFLRRLERAYSDAGYDDVYVELKVAGYYGLRTMRVFITSHKVSPVELTSIFVAALNRICDTEANISRMEKSRNAAMVEKLDKYEKSDDKALEIAWQMIGRGSMYDTSNRINCIYETSAHDVKVVARDVFRGSRPTYVVAVKADAEVMPYKSLLEQIGVSRFLKEGDDVPVKF